MYTAIGSKRSCAEEKILAGALNPVRQFLPDALILACCRAANHRWNRCVWNPVLTVLACIRMELEPDSSVRKIEDWVASLSGGLIKGYNDGRDFCAARGRLPAEVFYALLQALGIRSSSKAGMHFKGLPVWITDGTTLRTANTPANAKTFGRSRNQSGLSRSPIARLTLLVCAGCGAVLAAAVGPYSTSEWELFLQMLFDMPKGGLLVADRAYSSFLTLALMRRRGSHVLTRHNASRKHMRRVRRYCRGDEIYEWDKPQPQHVSRPDLLEGCPEVEQVRLITWELERPGYRTVPLQLVTTLLDPVLYPAHELVELYLRRWNIELDLRTLKAEYEMRQLDGRSPDIVRKQIYSTLLAYNCVTAVMSETGEAVRDLSHTRARSLLRDYSQRMIDAPTHFLPKLYREMLALIAEVRIIRQQRLPQPRALIQRPSTYPILMMSRRAWRRKNHRVA
jgi:hypothetical protein